MVIRALAFVVILAVPADGTVLTADGGQPSWESVTTTKGDLAVRGASRDQRLAVGSDGLCLKADSTALLGVSWASCGGGAGNFAAVTVDFGAAGSDTASTDASAAWVTGSSTIVCNATTMATADRVDGSEDAMIETLSCTPDTRSAGVGFTVRCNPALFTAFGKFVVHCTGG